MKTGKKYRMEVRISGKMYHNDLDILQMESEGIAPMLVIEGDCIEEILKRMGDINGLMATSNIIHGKEDIQPHSVCLPWEQEICNN